MNQWTKEKESKKKKDLNNTQEDWKCYRNKKPFLDYQSLVDDSNDDNEDDDDDDSNLEKNKNKKT